MSGDDGNQAGHAMRDLLRQRKAATAELALRRKDCDSPGAGKELLDSVRELEARIEAIDAAIERIELAVEIERQSDA